MSIKNLKPNAYSKYEQGYYVIKNPAKYRGNINSIIVRSSYEKRMCQFCDLSENVLEWSSEPIAILYTSLVDGKRHKYWIDFWVKTKEKEYLVEVKPNVKLQKPKKSRSKSYPKLLHEYLVNYSKFSAAIQFAKSSNMEFIIADENFLFNIK